MTECISCFNAKSQDNSDGLFLSLPSDVPLTKRIWMEARELFFPKYKEPPAAIEEMDGGFGFLVTGTEIPLSARLLQEAQFAAGRIARTLSTWIKPKSLKASA